MESLTTIERQLCNSLTTPTKIQSFLNSLGKKPSKDTHIVRSPRAVIKNGNANCMEGALLALALLHTHGIETYLLDLKVGERNTQDVDHVVTLFKNGDHWGAISKTSHSVLRYREPIYASVRELAISYFHEYFTDDGKKNLRSFSEPFDVLKRFGIEWVTSGEDLYEIAALLDESPHTKILTKQMERGLRRADPLEIEAGKLEEKKK